MGLSSDFFLDQQFNDWVDDMAGDYDFVDYYEPIRKPTVFSMFPVGVTYGNRQSVIRDLKVGDVLRFVHEENNPYDKNAILIVTESGEDIGYVSTEYSATIFTNIKNGAYYSVVSLIQGDYATNNLRPVIRVGVLIKPIDSTSEQHAETPDFQITNNVLVKYTGHSKTVVIPEEVTEIGVEAFRECTFIEQVVLPKKLKEIGEGAFCACKSLKEINFPNSLHRIRIDAFAACEGLTSICIPKNVAVIGVGAFAGCYNLKEASILSDGVGIDICRPFQGCLNLSTIVLSESVKNHFQSKGFCRICGAPLGDHEGEYCLTCAWSDRVLHIS